MGIKEVEKFIVECKKDGMNTKSLELWLSMEKGEIPKPKRKPDEDVLEYSIGGIVSWTHKGKDYIGKVYKLNKVTVGVEELKQPLSKWNIAPCYLKKIN